MIRLTARLIPSDLLRYDSLPEFTRQLLEKIGQYRKAGNLREAERRALDARDSAQKERAHIEHALALIHLSDVYREMGRLGPALQCAIHAYDILRKQRGQVQRHNEAVAAYNLGLLHHLLGNTVDALKAYRAARELLEQARKHWANQKEIERIRDCARLEQWIGSLSNCLMREECRYGPHSILIIPTELIGKEDGLFAVIELRIESYMPDQDLFIANRVFQTNAAAGGHQPNINGQTALTLLIGDRAFHMQTDDPLALAEQLVQEGKAHRVFEIPESVCEFIRAQKGDHVLTRQMGPERVDASYYIVDLDTGPEFVLNFWRDEEGRISFQSVVPFRIIGGIGDGDLSIYYPIARLEPAG